MGGPYRVKTKVQACGAFTSRSGSYTLGFMIWLSLAPWNQYRRGMARA
jgi:hypothetical protein